MSYKSYVKKTCTTIILDNYLYDTYHFSFILLFILDFDFLSWIYFMHFFFSWNDFISIFYFFFVFFDRYFQILQYFILLCASKIASEKDFALSSGKFKTKYANLCAVFLPMPGSISNLSTKFSSGATLYSLIFKITPVYSFRLINFP